MNNRSGAIQKSFFVAAGMAIVLFAYGYFLPDLGGEHAPDLNFLTRMLQVPFHPVVVHFPIALFISALFFKLAGLAFRKESFQNTAVYLYVFAALITPWIVRSGGWEADRMNLHHPLLDAHERFALWTMWTSLMSLPVLWFIRKEYPKYFSIIFLVVVLLTAGCVVLTGDRGGRMVYEYGVGMKP